MGELLALQVGEDDRDGLADLVDRERLRKRRPAEPAQAKALGVLLAAIRADGHESVYDGSGHATNAPVTTRPAVL
jgi:hypothetical protein